MKYCIFMFLYQTQVMPENFAFGKFHIVVTRNNMVEYETIYRYNTTVNNGKKIIGLTAK